MSQARGRRWWLSAPYWSSSSRSTTPTMPNSPNKSGTSTRRSVTSPQQSPIKLLFTRMLIVCTKGDIVMRMRKYVLYMCTKFHRWMSYRKQQMRLSALCQGWCFQLPPWRSRQRVSLIIWRSWVRASQVAWSFYHSFFYLSLMSVLLWWLLCMHTHTPAPFFNHVFKETPLATLLSIRTFIATFLYGEWCYLYM